MASEIDFQVACLEWFPGSLKNGRCPEWVKLLESASLRKALLQIRPSEPWAGDQQAKSGLLRQGERSYLHVRLNSPLRYGEADVDRLAFLS